MCILFGHFQSQNHQKEQNYKKHRKHYFLQEVFPNFQAHYRFTFIPGDQWSVWPPYSPPQWEADPSWPCCPFPGSRTPSQALESLLDHHLSQTGCSRPSTRFVLLSEVSYLQTWYFRGILRIWGRPSAQTLTVWSSILIGGSPGSPSSPPSMSWNRDLEMCFWDKMSLDGHLVFDLENTLARTLLCCNFLKLGANSSKSGSNKVLVV